MAITVTGTSHRDAGSSGTGTGYYPPPALPTYPVVNYSSISGATPANFATTMAAVSTDSYIRLDPNTDYYINNDFSMGAWSSGGYACYAPHVIGLVCDGTTDPTKRARIHMGAGQMSTTTLAKIPLQSSNQVNNLWALRCGPNGVNAPVYFHGIEFVGHDQRTDPNTGLPAGYNGLQLYTPASSTTLTWCKFRGFSQANYNAPPGENNTLSTYQGTGMNLYQVESDGVNGDGRRSGGAFSANGCTGIYWEDVYVHDTAVSGVTFSTAATNSGSLHTVRLKVRNNANHSAAAGQDFGGVNHEGVDGPIIHDSPDLLNPLDYNPGYSSIHFSFANQTSNANIQIINPVWNGLSEPGCYNALTIQVNTNYAGGVNKQTSLPVVTRNGTTMTPVNKNVITSAVNLATQYCLKTA